MLPYALHVVWSVLKEEKSSEVTLLQGFVFTKNIYHFNTCVCLSHKQIIESFTQSIR